MGFLRDDCFLYCRKVENTIWDPDPEKRENIYTAKHLVILKRPMVLSGPHTSEEVRVEVTKVLEEVGVTVCNEALLLPFEQDHIVLLVSQPT